MDNYNQITLLYGEIRTLKKNIINLNSTISDLQEKLENSKTSCPCCKLLESVNHGQTMPFFDLDGDSQINKKAIIKKVFEFLNWILKQNGIFIQVAKLVKYDSTKFNEMIFSIREQNEIALERVLYVKDYLHISDKDYTLLIEMLFLDLPTLHYVRELRQLLNNEINTHKFNDYSYFADIQKRIKDECIEYLSTNPLTKNIVIKLSGDGTLIGNQMFINITFTIINDTKKCMSSKGNYRIGLLKCKEDYDELREPIKYLMDEIKAVKTVQLGENVHNFNLTLGADYVFEAEINGLLGPMSKFPCNSCTINKHEFHLLDKHYEMVDDDEKSKTYMRSLALQKELLKKEGDERRGYVRESLSGIENSQCIKDMMHGKIGIYRLLSGELEKKLMLADKYDSKKKPNSKHCYLMRWFKFLSESKVKREPHVQNNKGNIMRNLNGVEVSRVFNNLKKSIFTTMFKDIEKIEVIEQVWIDFWTTYKAVCAHELKHEEIRVKMTAWHNLYLTVFHKHTITPYMHYFVCHLHEQVRLHGHVNLYNEQGIEQLNDFTTTDFFRGTNRHDGDDMRQILSRDARIRNYEINEMKKKRDQTHLSEHKKKRKINNKSLLQPCAITHVATPSRLKKQRTEIILDSDSDIEEIEVVCPMETIHKRFKDVYDCDSLQEIDKIKSSHILFWFTQLRKQFPEQKGLENPSALWRESRNPDYEYDDGFVNILFVNKGHWICLSNKKCRTNEIDVFDSLATYDQSNIHTIESAIRRMMPRSPEIFVNIRNTQQQSNNRDCGLFALANTTFLCHNLDPTNYSIDPTLLRIHFNTCVREKNVSQFPYTRVFNLSSSKDRLKLV